MDVAFESATTPSRRRAPLLAVALVALSTVCTTATHRADAAPAGPHLLDVQVADVLVRIRGNATCSGTPITGTRYVVTAAHCVLDAEGHLHRRIVVRDDVEYAIDSVLVDTGYVDHPTPALDAAVLVMVQVVPGPSASLGTSLPTSGTVTLAGFQPLDTDGSLLRGTTPHDRPHPSGATGGVVKVDSAVAGCERAASSVDVSLDQLRLECGLIPGGSGGALLAFGDGAPVLVGVISTVAADLSANGITPVSAVHRLLEDPAAFSHSFVEAQTASVRDGASLG